MNNQGGRGPIILLGAARSGTKLLRGILGCHSQLGVVPYDINYVWTLGHHGLGHDELTPDLLTTDSTEFIRNFVNRFAISGDGPRVVEKTVSNTLRVPFVAKVFPDALFVEIVRDGRDVCASAREQWLAPTGGGSVLNKLRTFPVRHAWRYGLDYAGGRLGRLLPGRSMAGTWGPRYLGISKDREERSLIEVCALQWARCVEACRSGLEEIPQDRVHRLRYEDLVTSPDQAVSDLLGFLEMNHEEAVGNYCRESVSSANIGKWKNQLDDREVDLIEGIIGSTLDRRGYS